jgi:hypothetical protein
VTPDGTVLDFFNHIYPNGGYRIEVIKSTDKGRTFTSRSRLVASIATVRGVVTPDEEELVRDAYLLFDVAVDRRNGNLYVVWQDTRRRGIDEIAFAMSTDGGDSWSTPVSVNQTPTTVPLLRRQAFIPSVEVAANGTVVVTYYDFRNDGDAGELTDHWAAFCSADCGRRASWGGELRLTARSFDYLDAPLARGRFRGDYMGLARAGDAVHAVFSLPVGENLTNLFNRKITFGGAGAVAALAD